ncbi:unnamed protein product [Closterium sp. Naga37s-1]|nr:unnamed protein product [Closterium sp. Naga37s-1]
MQQCIKPLPLGLFNTVLWLLSTRHGTLLLAGRTAFAGGTPFPQPFTKLSPQAREAMLLRWSVSSNFVLRTVFKVGSQKGVDEGGTDLPQLDALPYGRAAQQSDSGEGEAGRDEGTAGGGGGGGCEQGGGEGRPLDEAVVDCAAEGERLAAVLQGKGVEVLEGSRRTKGLLSRKKEGEGEPVVVRCDAVVIGSGCGGAIIAAQLAEAAAAAAAGDDAAGADGSKRQRKVLVLEAGGYFYRSDLSLLEAPSGAQLCVVVPSSLFPVPSIPFALPPPLKSTLFMLCGNGLLLCHRKHLLGSACNTSGHLLPSFLPIAASSLPPSFRGFLTTEDGGVGLLAGRAVGGGSTINWSASFRTPPHVTKEWANEYGLKAVLPTPASSSSAPHFFSIPLLFPPRLITPLDPTPSSHHSPSAQPLSGGWCHFGCWSGEKQSMLETWLPDAVTHGALILSRCAALRLLLSPNRPASTASSASSSTAGGGRKKRVVGVEARVERGEGVAQRLVVEANLHPGLLGCALPWLGSRAIKKTFIRFDRTASLIAIVRDRGRGTVGVDGSGRPVVTYQLCKEDQKSMQEALLLSLRILRAAGAVEVGTLHQSLKPFRCLIPPTVKADSADACTAKMDGTDELQELDGWQHTPDAEFEEYLKSVAAAGFKLNDCSLFSAHQTGSCPMGVSPKSSVVDENGESWEASGLFLGDGSVFPTPVGVNPMVSIESVAFMIGKRLSGRFRDGDFNG